MNRFVAKLRPPFFRRVNRIDMSIRDWREFVEMVANNVGQVHAGDQITLVDETTGTRSSGSCA